MDLHFFLILICILYLIQFYAYSNYLKTRIQKTNDTSKTLKDEHLYLL